MDQFPTEKFTEETPIKSTDEAFFISDAWNRPSQWFFAMESHHPIAYYSIYEVFLRLQKLESIEKPKVVFVTGPDAVKFGYGYATWPFVTKENPDQVFTEGTHLCLWNKTVTKVRKEQDYVDQLDMKEMVDDVDDAKENNNGTMIYKKVKRRDRINRHHGMLHWTDERNRKEIEFDGKCMDYLYMLDHGMNYNSADARKWK